jgi:hypothetical protein
MAENPILAQVLDGISALKTKVEIDAVRVAVKDRRDEIQNLGEDGIALTRGNSAEVIRVNKERYDYSKVLPKDLLMAEKWYMAPKPLAKSRSAYRQFRVWNAPKETGYKGNLIIEKATGRSVTPPPCESEGEEQVGEVESEEDEEEVTEAMAAVSVK